MLAERWSATDMTHNPKGTAELLKALRIGPNSVSDMETLAEIKRAEEEGREVELKGVYADLAELKAAMRPKQNPDPNP